MGGRTFLSSFIEDGEMTWTGKSTLPDLKPIPGTEFEDVAENNLRLTHTTKRDEMQDLLIHVGYGRQKDALHQFGKRPDELQMVSQQSSSGHH